MCVSIVRKSFFWTCLCFDILQEKQRTNPNQRPLNLSVAFSGLLAQQPIMFNPKTWLIRKRPAMQVVSIPGSPNISTKHLLPSGLRTGSYFSAGQVPEHVSSRDPPKATASVSRPPPPIQSPSKLGWCRFDAWSRRQCTSRSSYTSIVTNHHQTPVGAANNRAYVQYRHICTDTNFSQAQRKQYNNILI